MSINFVRFCISCLVLAVSLPSLSFASCDPADKNIDVAYCMTPNTQQVYMPNFDEQLLTTVLTMHPTLADEIKKLNLGDNDRFIVSSYTVSAKNEDVKSYPFDANSKYANVLELEVSFIVPGGILGATSGYTLKVRRINNKSYADLGKTYAWEFGHLTAK